MVQQATQAAYLDMMAYQTQSSKTTGSDSKSSFSEALDKEIAQDKQPVSNDKTEEQPKAEKEEKPEEPKQTETEAPKDEQAAEEQGQKQEVEVTAATPWMMQIQQNIQIVQPEQTAEQTAAADPAQVQQEAEVLAAVVTEEQMEGKLQTETELPMQAAAGEESAEAGLMKQTAVKVEESGQPVQTQQVQTSDRPVQAAVQQTQQEEQPLQNSQTEARTAAAGAAEAVSQTAQGQPAHTAAAAQQPAQTQTVNMSQPQQGTQNLAQTMAENIRQGVNEFEVWLEPANLGKIGVKVTYEGGRAMISIMCMSDKAMEMLSQNARTLGAIIQQNTGNNTIVVVEQQERQDYLEQESGKQDRGEEQQEEQEQNRGSNEEDAETQSFLQQLRLGLK